MTVCTGVAAVVVGAGEECACASAGAAEGGPAEGSDGWLCGASLRVDGKESALAMLGKLRSRDDIIKFDELSKQLKERDELIVRLNLNLQAAAAPAPAAKSATC